MTEDVMVCSVLLCNFYDNKKFTYEDFIEVCCDLFYQWYNKNSSIIRNFENGNVSSQQLEDYCLGDVSKRVLRELNLNNLLD